MGEAGEVLPLVNLLLSKESSYINGAILNLDGGASLMKLKAKRS